MIIIIIIVIIIIIIVIIIIIIIMIIITIIIIDSTTGRIQKECRPTQVNKGGKKKECTDNTGYNRGEIQGQFYRARGLDRNALFDRNQKHRDDTKIPLVLTYHPAFHRVYGILQTCLNALFVGTEQQQLFKDKIFVSFRRAKNFKDTLVRAKFYQPTYEQAEKGTFKCNCRRSCQICALIVEGETFRNFNDSRSFTISTGAYHCNSENVVYLL